MPRRTPRDTLDSLVAQIAAQADGLGIEQLTAANPDVPRRTLQRHLLRLVEDGRTRVTGRAAATRYSVVETAQRQAPSPMVSSTAPDIGALEYVP